MAALAGDLDLDLHPAALAAVDAERAVAGAARALGQDQHVGDPIWRGAGQLAAHHEHRTAAVVVLFGDGGVAAHHGARERALGAQSAQDAGCQDLADHAAELVGGAAAPEQVLPLVVGGQMAQLAAQEVAVNPGRIGEAQIGVDAAADRLVPARPQRAHGVRVAIQEDHPSLLRCHAVVGIAHLPPEVAEGVVADVLGAVDRAQLEDLAAQVLEPRPLVVGEAAVGVAALFGRPVDVVGGQAHRLAQQLHGEGVVGAGQLQDPGVEVSHRGPSAAARPAPAPWPPPARP